MFVHHPHDFRRIHRGAAAQRDNHVRFKAVHLLGAFTHDAQRRVSLNFKEDFGFDTVRFQHARHLIGVAVVEQEAVGDDKGAFRTVGGHLFQRNRQRAAAEVDGFRKFMPQHVFCSLSHGFLVDKVFRSHVFRDGVTAPGAAAQRQRRRQLEVVEVADTALRSRGINQNTRSFHAVAEEVHARFLVVLVGIEAGGVADTAHRHQFFRFRYGVFEIAGAVHRQRRREFFMGKGF